MQVLPLKAVTVLTAPLMALAIAGTPVKAQTSPNPSPNPTSIEILPQRQPIPSSKATVVRMFEDVTISPNFTPKAIALQGISGGAVETQTTSGRKLTETGECIGFIDAVPDHRITLTKPFRSLNLQVKSSGDTILLVRGPGGTWCSDDISDRNPAIGGDWLEGTYEIWVGSYEQNTSYPYILQITEQK